jgi:hypothetical protein
MQGITIFKTTPLRRKAAWIKTVIGHCIARLRLSPKDVTGLEKVGDIHDNLPRRKVMSMDTVLSGFRPKQPDSAPT